MASFEPNWAILNVKATAFAERITVARAFCSAEASEKPPCGRWTMFTRAEFSRANQNAERSGDAIRREKVRYLDASSMWAH